MKSNTGFWFQSARGRAMVRNRQMAAARHKAEVHRDVANGRYDAEAAGRILNLPLSLELRLALSPERLRAFVLEMLAKDVAWHVKRAREAHRNWRKYRRYHEAELASSTI